MKIRLSIIIPVYNAAKHFEALKETLRSISNQPEIEILLINDGSEDESYTLVLKLAEEWSNVTVLNKPNGGAASARNIGIKAAKGAYLAFLDADDRIDFEQLFRLLEMAEEKQLDLCAFDLRYIDTTGTVSGNGLQHPIDYNTLQSGQFFLKQGYQPSSICVFLVRRAFVTGNSLFFHEGITHEDVELSFRWMLHAQKVWFTKAPIYYYYQNEGSVTNQLTQEKREAYLMDEAKIASLMRNNLSGFKSKEQQRIIRQNYNSVVWNLLYVLWKKNKVYGKAFQKEITRYLKAEQLFPIRGPLKTNLQRLSNPFFSVLFYLK